MAHAHARARAAVGEIAGRRPSAAGPCRPEQLLALAPRGQPRVGVPDRSALAFDPRDAARDALHQVKATPSAGGVPVTYL